MIFAGFSLAYSVIATTTGAIFCLIVAPFIGMHWYHWLISGLGFCLMTFCIVVGSFSFSIVRAGGARNFWHGLFTIIVPPCAVWVMSAVPLAHVPLAGWLVPGIVLIIAWLALVSIACAPEGSIGSVVDEPQGVNVPAARSRPPLQRRRNPYHYT